MLLAFRAPYLATDMVGSAMHPCRPGSFYRSSIQFDLHSKLAESVQFSKEQASNWARSKESLRYMKAL
jgi:hypothetical protein